MARSARTAVADLVRRVRRRCHCALDPRHAPHLGRSASLHRKRDQALPLRARRRRLQRWDLQVRARWKSWDMRGRGFPRARYGQLLSEELIAPGTSTSRSSTPQVAWLTRIVTLTSAPQTQTSPTGSPRSSSPARSQLPSNGLSSSPAALSSSSPRPDRPTVDPCSTSSTASSPRPQRSRAA